MLRTGWDARPGPTLPLTALAPLDKHDAGFSDPYLSGKRFDVVEQLVLVRSVPPSLFSPRPLLSAPHACVYE